MAAVLWLGIRPTFAAPIFARTNHRGAVVPVGAGILVVIAALVVAAVERGLVGLGVDQDVLRAGDLVLLAAVGFGLLGFIDDVAEVGDAKGFRGSPRRAARGPAHDRRAQAARWPRRRGGRHRAGRRRPPGAARRGRAAGRRRGQRRQPARPGPRVGPPRSRWLLGGVLLATHLSDPPAGVAVVLGAAAGLLVFDLREELMLGDAGANAIGAAIGLGVVLACSFPVRIAALVLVVVLNVLSERVSFSAVIARTPVLRELDRLGRTGEPPGNLPRRDRV